MSGEDVGRGRANDDAGLLQHLPGAIEYFTTDVVEHQFDVPSDVLEAFGLVVDDVVCAEAAHVFDVSGGHGCEDLGTCLLGVLHGISAESTCRAVDQNSLA